ncbi:MAG: Uma2 family endonuclease [Blastocatellia bacterium]|nr:Uma2 family endonuclease [Blastocatellia bacterium]
MSTTPALEPPETAVAIPLPIVLHSPESFKNNDYLFQFCQLNAEWRIERNLQGDIEIMPPTGGVTGNRNAKLTGLLAIWAFGNNLGQAFDSSAGFLLPNGAMRSPDASWVSQERLSALTDEECEKFLPLCPDFVVELRSSTDSLKSLKNKMVEYIENGAQLGWLIDPQEQRVIVYRPNAEIEILDDPETLSGESVLPGLVFEVRRLWEPLKQSESEK